MTAAWVLAALGGGYALFLLAESALARRWRKRLSRVAHVNGTRGKSSVTRLIDAGLRAGGLRVMSKSTGTLPRVIRVNGEEEPLRRRGNANIREQLFILRRAAREGAQVLVVECMAVDPELQRVSQHRMLRADLAVITNARRDHGDVMGPRRADVLEALLSTVPRRGLVFTADGDIFPALEKKAAALDGRAVLAPPAEAAFAHPDNVAVALSVCQALGVDGETARRGMEAVRPDPYAERLVRVGETWVADALSANDVDSTVQAYARAREATDWDAPLALLLCLRADRPARTREMARLARILAPDTMIVLGPCPAALRRELGKAAAGGGVIRARRAEEVPFPPGALLLAAGNIQGEGMRFSDAIREAGHDL